MTFLQPTLLLALPLVLLPVIIHLLNRLRYRSVKWGAMMFLIRATRSSTRRAKLRQYLLLLSRMLIVLMIVLAVSRMLVGGWFGTVIAGSPETVIVLLDRSASMEATNPKHRVSRRELALDLVGQAAESMSDDTRFVLIESVFVTPHEIADPSALPETSLARATDTAANLPDMLAAAVDYIMENKPGRVDIWVASDLQASNWHPKSDRWTSLVAQLKAMPDPVRICVLALQEEMIDNVSVSVSGLRLVEHTSGTHLALSLNLAQLKPDKRTVPLVTDLAGTRSQSSVDILTQDHRHLQKVKLVPGNDSSGWGSVEVPADENIRDNTCFFAFGERQHRAAVGVFVSTVDERYAQLACAPDPAGLDMSFSSLEADQVTRDALKDVSTLIWQAPRPDDSVMETIESFVEDGGTLLCLPPADSGTEGLFDIYWGEVEVADEEKPFRIGLWDEKDGPLANIASGRKLPVSALTIMRRQAVATTDEGPDEESDNWYPLARFEDGKPFLVRRQLGDGRIYAFMSLPREDWSDLGEGLVLVPVIQRIMEKGGQRLALARQEICGAWQPDRVDDPWTCVDSSVDKDLRCDAGVYRLGPQTVALNRPVSEDMLEALSGDEAQNLFGDLQVRVLDRITQSDSDAEQSEVWRMFVCLALLAMVAESQLMLSMVSTKKGSQ